MLDQYIMNCLKNNNQQLMELEDKLKKLQMEEESCHNMIKKLTENVDVGREFFSPRNLSDSTKQKVSDIKKQIEELHLQQVKITDEINQKKDEVKKYENMLAEIKKRDNEKYQIRQLKKEPPVLEEKEEFKKILARVDKSLSLLNTDVGRCKTELTNLKYYLKALLSEK